MAQVNAERAAAARGEPPPTPPQQPQEPQPPLGSAPTPTPPPLPTPTPTPSSADVDVLRQMRQTSVEQIDRLRAAMSGLEAAALAEQMQLQRIEFALEKAARDARYAEADRVARRAQGSDGARGVASGGAIRPVLRKYIILPRAIFIVVFSHTSERTGCLVLAPRSPRPESPSASRQTKSPSPSGGAVFRPIRASAARRDLGLSSPRPSPGVGIPPGIPPSTPGHGILGPPTSPPPGPKNPPNPPPNPPRPLRTRLLRRSPETRACHPRDRTRPRPRRPGRDRTAPRDTRRVPGHTPKHTAGRYPDPRRGIPSRVAGDRGSRVARRRASRSAARRRRHAAANARFERASCASSCASSCGGTPNAATCSGVHNSLSSATKRSSRHDDPAAHRLLKSRRARQSIFRWSGRVTSAGGAGRPAARRRSARSGAAMASFAADQN